MVPEMRRSAGQENNWPGHQIESFNGKLRDDLFSSEILTALPEKEILIEKWRGCYNTVAALRGHMQSALRDRARRTTDLRGRTDSARRCNEWGRVRGVRADGLARGSDSSLACKNRRTGKKIQIRGTAWG